jgi:hypothetical protein
MVEPASGRSGRLIRSLYAICLLAAASTHAYALIQHGVFWDYGGAPFASAVFWTSLTVLDPAAATLLLLARRSGVVLTVAIIVVDVVHNAFFAASDLIARHAAFDLLQNWMLTSQVVFMGFVLATVSTAWPRGRDPGPMPAWIRR